jgi:hypothetical protein
MNRICGSEVTTYSASKRSRVSVAEFAGPDLTAIMATRFILAVRPGNIQSCHIDCNRDNQSFFSGTPRQDERLVQMTRELMPNASSRFAG